MSTSRRITDAELAEIQRRRPGIRASFACEGISFTAEDDRLFAKMDAERMPEEDRIKLIIELQREKQRARAVKAAS